MYYKNIYQIPAHIAQLTGLKLLIRNGRKLVMKYFSASAILSEAMKNISA